ncbi:MAG TPA: response regulator transcription factor [Acidimicrobiales bacterium]|nr:response regulator transcription factor [Acidimicrobiales bacterium]
MNERILFVEDDDSLRETAAILLERVGFCVTAVGDGKEALDTFSSGRFDLVLLDVMLPSVHGFDVCREIRRTSRTPIVMLTARTDTADVVAALELGADDYVTKPFEASELLARIRAVLRRGTPDIEPGTIRLDGLEIDAAAFRASNDGVALQLTATEFRLLLELVRHCGQVLTREFLLDRVWGHNYLGDSRLVDMAVKRVRDKLGDDPRNPRYITTVRGVGYRVERS